MDPSWLNWFVPLVLGAGLTFFFGWLDSTLKYRRQRKDEAANRDRDAAEKRRVEAREHAQRALELASLIRDDLESKRAARERNRWGWFITWDAALTRELRDVGILIPNAAVREAIGDATNLVTAGAVVADDKGWDKATPADIQLSATQQLRMIVGAYLRSDELPAEPLQWLEEMTTALTEAWAAIDREFAAEHDD